jgi:hypothetical protein
MNPPSGLRQQQQQQKQKTLRMQKHENTLEFHSRLIEAPEGISCAGLSRPQWLKPIYLDYY